MRNMLKIDFPCFPFLSVRAGMFDNDKIDPASSGMFDKSGNGTVSFTEFGALWKYVTDWQNCFRSFDRDNSGNIDRSELQTALRNFGYQLSPDLVDMILRKYDRAGNGTIYFDDFIQCCIVLYVSIKYNLSCSVVSLHYLKRM